jgi:hypothetical protein
MAFDPDFLQGGQRVDFPFVILLRDNIKNHNFMLASRAKFIY